MVGGVSRSNQVRATSNHEIYAGGRAQMWILRPADAGSHPTVANPAPDGHGSCTWRSRIVHLAGVDPAPRFGRMRANLSRVNEAKPAAEFETSHKRNDVSQSRNLIYVPRPVRVKTAVRCRSLDRHLHALGHFQVQRPRGGGSLHVQTRPKHSPACAARSRPRVPSVRRPTRAQFYRSARPTRRIPSARSKRTRASPGSAREWEPAGSATSW